MRILRRRITVRATTITRDGMRSTITSLELWLIRHDDDGSTTHLTPLLPVVHDDSCRACWS